MSMPVRQAEAEILAAGGMDKWLKTQHLLAQAQRRMQTLPEERTRLLASAVASNLYAPLIGEGASSAGGV